MFGALRDKNIILSILGNKKPNTVKVIRERKKSEKYMGFPCY